MWSLVPDEPRAEAATLLQGLDARKFQTVLGHFPTGVAALTALPDGGEPTGMVVGSFTSVSLDPPLLSRFCQTRRAAHSLAFERPRGPGVGRRSVPFVCDLDMSGRMRRLESTRHDA